MKKIFKKIKELSLEKSEYSSLGHFSRAFLEKSNTITNDLFPNIEASLNEIKFQAKLLKIYTKELEADKLHYEKEMKNKEGIPNSNSHEFYKPMIDVISKKLEIKTFDKLMKSIDNNFKSNLGNLEVLDSTYRYIHGVSGKDYITDNYKYYYIGNLLYWKPIIL